MKKIIYMLALFMLAPLLSNAQSKDTVTTSSGLKYIQLQAGEGEKPVDGSKVKVYYKGTLMNGKEFDSNIGDVPFKFTVGKKEVIPGWEEALKLMKEGEKAKFIIPAKLAYGKKGSKDEDGNYIIPPDSDLIFEIELVNVK